MSFWLFVIIANCSSRSTDILPSDDTLRFPDNMPTERGQAVSFDHYSYCNHHKSVTGSEGTDLTGYSFQQVHIVLSPGQSDTSAKVNSQGHNFPSMSCDLQESFSLKGFKEVADIYTDVSRNDQFHHLHPSFPKVCANDHLTSAGFEQLISIGQHLNAAYFSKRVHKRLQPKYSSIHVESVLTEKSYHSVLAFLYGFLENKQLFKTKIHKANRNFCEFLESDLTSCQCSKTRELAPHISQALSKGTFMFKNSFPNTDKIREILQTNISGQTSSLQLFHTLMQYKCDKNSKLCIGDTLCHISEENRLAKLHEVLAEYHHSTHTDAIFRSYSELRVYPFLQQILSRASKVDTHQPVNVYMGHSHFIEYLTSSLGIFPWQITPLASRFVIEVYKKNGGQIDEGDLYVRYLYNGDDVTHEVTGCTLHMENKFCKIKGLKQLTEALRSQYLDQC